ncbi:MAG: metalloregulator ArsR/SmtB family transcription factor [Fimbriimonadaceae bacterium]|nr:metalloregulator ArsR/SmtB family transcription factor [Alphaproteobacteria bacterium]
MKQDQAAKILAELGNTTRLAIFRYLVKAGPEGASVGQIQASLDIPGSTLSHHISRLVSAGLVQQERESRTLHCRPQYDTVRNVLEFLMAECCTGVEMTTGPEA